jgi:hypothetical protein
MAGLPYFAWLAEVHKLECNGKICTLEQSHSFLEVIATL